MYNYRSKVDQPNVAPLQEDYQLTAQEFNAYIQELENTVTNTGLALETLVAGTPPALVNQLSTAISLVTKSDRWYVLNASSTSNAIILEVPLANFFKNRFDIAAPQVPIGTVVFFRPTSNSTGPCTLRISLQTTPTVIQTTATNIVDQSGTALTIGSLTANRVVGCIFDGSNWVAFLGTTSTSSATNFTAGFFRDGNFGPSTPTTAAAVLSFQTGSCSDSLDQVLMTLPAFTNKSILTNWSAGNNGGLKPPALTITTNTNYHVFAIADAAGGNVDYGIDTNLNASALLTASGRTRFRRIGFINTNTATTIRPFKMMGRGNEKDLVFDQLVEFSSQAASTALQTVTLSIRPVGVEFVATLFVDLGFIGSGNGLSVIGTGTLPTTAASFQTNGTATNSEGSIAIVSVGTTGQVSYRCASTNGIVAISSFRVMDYL